MAARPPVPAQPPSRADVRLMFVYDENVSASAAEAAEALLALLRPVPERRPPTGDEAEAAVTDEAA